MEDASDRSSIGDNRIKPPEEDNVSAQRRRNVSLHRGSQAQAAKRVRSLTGHGRCFDMERVTRRANAVYSSDVGSSSFESLNTLGDRKRSLLTLRYSASVRSTSTRHERKHAKTKPIRM